MSSQDPNIRIQTSVDQSGLDTGLRSVSDKVKHTTEEGSEMFSNMFKALTLEAAVEKGFEVVSDFFKDSIEQAKEAQINTILLQNSLNNLGRGGDFSGILKNIDSLSEKFIVEDDDIIKSTTALETYGKLTQKQINDLLPVILNYSKQQQISVDEATESVIRGLEGQGRGLKKLGVVVKESNTSAENYGIIMDKLAAKVEGAADAANDSALGGMNKLEVSTKQLEETVGGLLIPILGQLGSILAGVNNFLKTTIEYFQEHKEAALALGAAIGTIVTSYIAYNVYLERNTILAGLNTAATFVSTAATEGLSVALEAAGIAGTVAWGAITLGLTAVIAGLVYAYQKFDKFRAVLAGIGAAAKELLSVFEALGETIIGAVTLDPTMIKKGIEDLKKTAKEMGDAYGEAYNKSLKESDDKRKAEEEAENKKKAALAAKNTSKGPGINEEDQKKLADRAKKAEEARKKAAEKLKADTEKIIKDNDAKNKVLLEQTEENTAARVALENKLAEDTIAFYEKTGKSGKKIYQELGLTDAEWAAKKLDINKKVNEDEQKYAEAQDKRNEEAKAKAEKELQERKDKADKALQDTLTLNEQRINALKRQEDDLKDYDIQQKADLEEQINTIKGNSLTAQMNNELAFADTTGDEVAKIKAKYLDKQAEQDKAYLETKKKDELAAIQTIQGYAQQGMQAGQDLADLADQADKNRLKAGEQLSVETQKKEFKRKQALSLANAALNIAEAISKAIAESPMTGGAPGSIIAGIMGALQIAKIVSTKFTPEGGSSGTSTTAPSIPSVGSSETSPTLSADQVAGIGQVSTPMVQNNGLQYTKVYVTESDIKKTASKVNVIQTRAILGK